MALGLLGSARLSLELSRHFHAHPAPSTWAPTILPAFGASRTHCLRGRFEVFASRSSACRKPRRAFCGHGAPSVGAWRGEGCGGNTYLNVGAAQLVRLLTSLDEPGDANLRRDGHIRLLLELALATVVARRGGRRWHGGSQQPRPGGCPEPARWIREPARWLPGAENRQPGWLPRARGWLPPASHHFAYARATKFGGET